MKWVSNGVSNGVFGNGVGGWFGEQGSSSDCWGHPQAGGPPGPCSNRVIRRYFPALCFQQNRDKRRCNILAFGLIYTEASPLASFDSLVGQAAQQVTWLLSLQMGKGWAVVTFPSAGALCLVSVFCWFKKQNKTKLWKLHFRQTDNTSLASLEKWGES